MKMKLVVIAMVIFGLVNANPVLAVTQSSPEVEWQILLGGESSDTCYSMQPTQDGGYILVGKTSSTGGDVSGHKGKADIWVVKVDENGDKLWQKCLGGSENDFAYSIQQTRDGGYIVGGGTFSKDGDALFGINESEDTLVNHGENDAWVIKLDASGEIQWQKQFGGSKNEYIRDIRQTSDGGYIFTGFTNSTDYDLSGREGDSIDIWVVKLDAMGTMDWQKCLGGDNYDYSYRIREMIGGGYVGVGYSYSNDGGLLNHGGIDAFVVKLDAEGDMLWQRSLGGSADDSVLSVDATSEGGFIVAGRSRSNDGDLLNDGEVPVDNLVNHGEGDVWVIKFNADGVIIWQKSLGGSSNDSAYAVQQTSDGGYIVAGESISTNGDVLFGVEDADDGLVNHGGKDAWIIKFDADGTMLWQKSVGGASNDSAWSIQEKSDGGYVFAGGTKSNDGEQSSNHGTSDFWIVKLAMKENEANSSNGSESAGRPRALIRERSFAGQTIATFKENGFGLLKEIHPETGELDFRAPLRSGERDVQLKIPFAEIRAKAAVGAKNLLIEYRGQSIKIPMSTFECEELLLGMPCQDEAMIEIHLTENEDGSIEKVIQLLVVEQVDEKTKLVHRVNVQ